MIVKSSLPNSILKDFFQEYYYIHINSPLSSIKQKPVIDDCCYDIIFFKELDSVLIHGEKLKETLIAYKLFTIHQLPPPCSIRIKKTLTFFSIKLQPWINAAFFSYIKQPGAIDISKKYAYLLSFHKSIMEKPNLWSYKYVHKLV